MPRLIDCSEIFPESFAFLLSSKHASMVMHKIRQKRCQIMKSFWSNISLLNVCNVFIRRAVSISFSPFHFFSVQKNNIILIHGFLNATLSYLKLSGIILLFMSSLKTQPNEKLTAREWDENEKYEKICMVFELAVADYFVLNSKGTWMNFKKKHQSKVQTDKRADYCM
jgi:hypothetical protein